MLQSFKELKVWQRSIDLVKVIYFITGKFPDDEKFGLVIQMRRAAISIPANIAEGYKRSSLREYIRFLNISNASSAELETHIIITKDLFPYVDFYKSEILLLEVQKMLAILIKSLIAKI
ncbi:MAG: four helix bundle protein [Patescibacteria group bacterium]|jgi:four helix bundle protein